MLLSHTAGSCPYPASLEGDNSPGWSKKALPTRKKRQSQFFLTPNPESGTQRGDFTQIYQGNPLSC